MGSINNKKSVPFTLRNADVEGGIYERINSEFTGGVEIGNYHLDNYAGLDTAVLQSPITDLWVGGHTHRHVPINTGNDNASNRPEAWHIEFDNISDPTNPTITFHSYQHLNSPGAFFTREEYVKRPINIKNIRQNSLGNFKNNYEVVQTSGRRISNNLIVDGFVAGGVLTTQFVTGSHNYSLPVLNSITGSKSVIVERFNAPGSKEESSRGALDREGEEMSPNISLPWRNYKIRQPFYSQLSQSTPQFGTSLHGVYRNTLPGSGSRNDENDNGFITRPIPRTDIHYSWITASSTTTAGELGGYQSTYYGESDIAFISGSEIIVDSTKYIIDNLGISSLIKDKKQVDLDSKLLSYSSDVGLSASFGELTRTPYSFTTWTSIRTGEHPISRGLRKNNIISIQQRLKPEDIKTAKLPYDGVEYNNFRKTKRSSTSLNFTEPAVTFKYKPLKTRVRLTGAPEGSEQVIVHTFTNNIGNFANKDLRIETGLEEKERSEQFYDFLKQTYDEAGATGNPIAEFLGYQYSEIVWPREENTGLSKTRKREAYILDQPGFDRDGYDRQLGTQRVFWRDNQEDRRRSKNSEGGYYSSMNYLSTEETGSNFVQYEEGISINNQKLFLSSSFATSSLIDNGFFNSISLMESGSQEREVIDSTIEIKSEYLSNLTSYRQDNKVIKRGFLFDTSGEFNNFYYDFYEQFIDQSNVKKSIGSLYKNTGYKNLFTKNINSSSNFENIIKTEDDEIFFNPKLKYLSFIGGVELNTSSYIQQTSSFGSATTQYGGLLINNYTSNLKVNSLFSTNDELYIAGRFAVAGNVDVNNIVKYNKITDEYTSIGNPGEILNDVVVSGSDIYVCGNTNGIQKWDEVTQTWNRISTDSNNTKVSTFFFSGSDIYVGRYQTNSTTNINCFLKWDGMSWTTITGSSGGTITNNSSQYAGVITFHKSGSDLYIGGKFSDVDGNTNNDNIVKWDGTDFLPLGTGLGSTSGKQVEDIDSYGGNIYAVGNFENAGGVTGANKVSYFDGSNWNIFTPPDLGSHALATITNIIVNNGIVYINGYRNYSGNIYQNRILKYENSSWSIFNGWFNDTIQKIVFFDNKLIAAGLFNSLNATFSDPGTIIEKISYYDNEFWRPFGSGNRYDVFTDGYFLQNFNKEDFLFSTLDYGLIRETEKYSNKTPFYDSYEDSIKNENYKDYSIIPEFKISENLDFYSINNYNFRLKNNSFLTLDGSKDFYKSSNNESSSYLNEFLNSYASSDILKENFNIVNEHENTKLEKLNLKVEGIKKLIPYNGFYPQERTVQISNLYNDYIDNNLHGGLFSLSYLQDYDFKTLVDPVENYQKINSISVEKFQSKYYVSISSQNKIEIYTGSVDDLQSLTFLRDIDYLDLETLVTPSLSKLGFSHRIISASNGLNLFLSSQQTSSADGSLGLGTIMSMTSSDGLNWSLGKPLEVYGLPAGSYITGSTTSSEFGQYFDLYYENKENSEKIFLVISAPFSDDAGLNVGRTYLVTGSMVNNEWRWSDKSIIHQGTAVNNLMGTGVSFISCSSGYQIFMGERKGDSPNADFGTLWVSTSSLGDSWSTPIAIASGSSSDSGLGLNNVKAVNYNNKTYVFFSEPFLDNDSYTKAGSVFVISSSINNEWQNLYHEKTTIYSRKFFNDYALDEDSCYSIEAKVGEDNLLYYTFINGLNYGANQSKDKNQVLSGFIDEKENWQTLENNNLYNLEIDTGLVTTEYKSPLAVSTYSLEGTEVPIFFGIFQSEIFRNNIFSLKKAVFTEFSMRIQNEEKYFKHAALEPIIAPGILYNTIKSGIAVDWPCATGSNTSIEPYGANTIVNTYYPKPFQMASFEGENIFESSFGHLRSNIDYRVPFENIIFPGEAFPVKDFLENDFIKRTTLTSLPDDDEFVKFINGTYIYGGYEPYTSPVDFGDVKNLGPKRFSVPFVYRKAGSQDSGLYTLAMSNFLAETIKFFLKDEKMTTFVSDPDYKWKEFNQNKTYYMDIVLEKSPDLVMMEAYHSDLHPTGSNGEKMNGRYFGYPINKTDKEIWGDTDFTAEEKRLIHNDPAYAPYTPPYFEGVARARISFKPQVSGKYGLQEIFDNATVENIFVDIAKGATTGSDAYVNAMPINSSIDIFGAAQSVEVTIDETTGEQTVRELQDSQNWIISPRMETPVLDFSSQSLTPYENNYSKTGGFGRGMWSGYGSVPVNGKGIKIRLEDPFATKPSPNTGSLLSQIGLKPEERNVGSLAEQKLISEAVVVIPYLDQTTRNAEYSTSRKNKTDFEFIKISKKLFNKQLSNYRQGKPAISPGDLSNIQLESAVQDTSITEMIEKMERYVIPPEMNFLEYKDIDPFVMYIAEFEHVLDQEDLKDIWQGLMPKISYTAETDSVTVSHDSAPYEFFEGKEIPENLRWMVFKVKRKAEYNYFNVTATTKDDNRFNFNKIIGRKEGTDVYSYNWPYDFFSLVEFGKVELQLDYKKKEE